MISEEEVSKYKSHVSMQLDALKNLDVDDSTEEDFVDHRRMISYLEGQLKALNRVFGEPEKPVRIITFVMSGYSDDNIEFDGDIRDEVSATFDGADKFLLSDGTAGTIEYTKEGVWRIKIMVKSDDMTVSITSPTQQEIDDDTSYTEKATFTGPIEWIIFDSGEFIKV